MPGLVVFRRRWSVGSDDLVVPGIFLFVVHLIWIIVLTVSLAVFKYDFEVTCIRLLWEHLVGYVTIISVCLVIEFFISVVSLRGSILDTDSRSSISYLLYMRLVFILFEVLWIGLGVAWLICHFNTCAVNGAKQALLGMVICNACILMSIFATVWCTFDSAGRSWVKMKNYQRSMREAESRFQYKRSGTRQRNWRQRKVLRAYQDSWDQRCRLLFCCMGKSDRNKNSFADIARLLSDFFRDLDVVPSDVVAGLVLLRKFQKIEREAIINQHKNNTYNFLSGVPITPNTRFLALSNPKYMEDFRSVIHFMHFALAAYGWPMFLMTNSATGVCQLCARLKCDCCSPESHEDETVIVQDNCCRCNYAALSKMIEVGEVEVLYASYHVDVGQTPFFVAVDWGHSKVVISIRGTLSMKDVITDLNAEGEPLPLDPPREDWIGHKGMVQAAEYIRVKLAKEGILTKAFEFSKKKTETEFDLVIVGHSLGAGTAAILAILLYTQYPRLHCFSYSPPGGSLSLPAVESTKSFITSVVVGKDVVPRIGLHQLESLRSDLISTIKRSKDPKWKTIVCSAVCCGCAPMPTSAIELKLDENSMEDYQRERAAARQLAIHPSDSSVALTIHQPLYPPGNIIHIVRHHPTKGEQVLKKNEPVYQAVWANNTDFDEVLISPVMVQDHMPDNVLDALYKVVTTIGPAKPQRVPSGSNSASASADYADSESSHLLAAHNTAYGSPKAVTPHKLCLETSFTSLQSPSTEACQKHKQQCQNLPSVTNSKLFKQTSSQVMSPYSLNPVLSWEYASILEEQVASSYCCHNHSGSNGNSSNIFSSNGMSDKSTGGEKSVKVDLIHDDWFGLAPLATPESLSEVSSISSRASSLVLTNERPPKDLSSVVKTHGYQGWNKDQNTSSGSVNIGPHSKVLKGCVKSAESMFNDISYASSNISDKQTDDILKIVSSSGEDLSYVTARQMSSEEEIVMHSFSNSSGNNENSSDNFVSVQGTPLSSFDSVTVSVDVHIENDCKDYDTVLSVSTSSSIPFDTHMLQPTSVSDFTEDESQSETTLSSPKKVKFYTPDDSFNSDETSSSDTYSTPKMSFPKMFQNERYVIPNTECKANDASDKCIHPTLLYTTNIKRFVCHENKKPVQKYNNFETISSVNDIHTENLKDLPYVKKIQQLQKNDAAHQYDFVQSDKRISPSKKKCNAGSKTTTDYVCPSSFGTSNTANSQLENHYFQSNDHLFLNEYRQKKQDRRNIETSSCQNEPMIDDKKFEHFLSENHHITESLPLLSNIAGIVEKPVLGGKKTLPYYHNSEKGESSV